MEDKVDELRLVTFNNVSKYKSVRRAMRRGHMVYWGEIIPHRPFNNRKRTEGRRAQLVKEEIYGRIKNKNRTVKSGL